MTTPFLALHQNRQVSAPGDNVILPAPSFLGFHPVYFYGKIILLKDVAGQSLKILPDDLSGNPLQIGNGFDLGKTSYLLVALINALFIALLIAPLIAFILAIHLDISCGTDGD